MVKDVRTPHDVARREKELRNGGYQVYDGPSLVQAGRCFPGAAGHGHLKSSTHFVPTGLGGAVDVGRDPVGGGPVSTIEKAHLDDLARVLMGEDFRVIWGVKNHFDHLHFDYNLRGAGGGHQVEFQGPNAGFTVAQIVWVQTSLHTLCRPDGARYYDGILDGLREAKTLAALKAFQKDNRLVEDGKPGTRTQAALKAALAARSPVPPPLPAPLTEAQRQARLAAAVRLAGDSAADTAARVRAWKAPRGQGLLLAGRGTADIFPAAELASRTGAVLIPVPVGSSLPDHLLKHVGALRPAWVRVVGGPRAIPDTSVVTTLEAAGHC